MRIDLIRCACGYEVRAMMRGGHAVARIDRETWRKRCLEAHRARGPLTCRRFLEVRERSAKSS